MSADERKISFLNNYFIFKKVRSVDAETIKLELAHQSTAEIKLNLNDTELGPKWADHVRLSSLKHLYRKRTACMLSSCRSSSW